LRDAERERARALSQTDPSNPANIEEADPGSAEMEKIGLHLPADSERRRGLRHSHETALLVYGSDADKQPFHEEAETIDANEEGCMLSLDNEVCRGQHLILTNTRNLAEQECRVVYVGRRVKGKLRVGVEFVTPAPQFWRMR
jgi:hypothetical protein